MSGSTLHTVLRELADPEIAERSKRFFKTGKGQYGEGDCFLGVRVPVIRRQVRVFKDSSLTDITRLLASTYHEERLFALLLLVDKYSKSDQADQAKIYSLYLSKTQYINNWDLVDSSAYQIVGRHLEHASRKSLYTLVSSKNLWERRIAIIATYWFIKHDDFADTLALSAALLNDQEDLIHKAVGWMLREVGNRNRAVEEEFLVKHYQNMPRTMLRYAIEKFSQVQRKRYLSGEI